MSEMRHDSNSSFDLRIRECGKPSRNRNIRNSICTEVPMQDMTYTRFETEKKGFKIILEFPDNSVSDTNTREEVKKILSELLQEQTLQVS